MAIYSPLIALVFSVSLFVTPSVFAHPNEKILQCSIFSALQPIKAPKLLKTEMVQIGLVAEVYDVTGDGLGDIAIYSASLGGAEPDGTIPHKDEPIFYEVDNDGDENPDLLYVDQFGLKTCDSLILYKKIDGHITKGGLVRWRSIRDDLLYDGRPLHEYQEEDYR